ncbi:unnamed protein product [Peronospora effusa]|nr:unnamed protein product [Peronospora effusa]
MATTKRRNMVLHFESGFGATIESGISLQKKVLQELDLLVGGHHLNGLPTMADHFRLKLQPSARCATTFYRDGFEADDTALALGTLIKVPPFYTKLTKEGAYSPNN